MPLLFQLPKVTSLPGAKLYFYRTNTSTPQDVFTDADLDVAHEQPVEADIAGVFPPIYLDPTLPDYRVTHTTSADVLIYTVDDVPSNQNVQQSMRLESTNPFVFLYDTDGTSGSRKYRIRAAANAFEVQASNEDETVFTTILQFVGGVLYSNATEVAVTSSGTFTATLTGMTTTTTGTVNYRKVNNVVTMWAESAITGTSNSTSMSMTGVPASLLVLFKAVPCIVQDNTQGSMSGVAVVNNTDIDFMLTRQDLVANLLQSSYTGFTNGGTKGIPSGWCITYTVA